MTTRATEDYVRAVYILGERDSPYLSAVATYLGVTKASASEKVKMLCHEGFIAHHPYAELALTSKGMRLAQKLTYKHRIIESFLADVLGLPKKRLHEEAHKLEHAFSDESIRRMRRLLKNPSVDPHGQPIRRMRR